MKVFTKKKGSSLRIDLGISYFRPKIILFSIKKRSFLRIVIVGYTVQCINCHQSRMHFFSKKKIFFDMPSTSWSWCYYVNSISIISLPTYSWSLLMTCPYHLSLPSLIFIPNRYTLTVSLINSLLILSFLITPIANLNIFISATSISSTCFFVTATVSSPYIIADLTTKLYTFPFTLAGKFLSRITPDSFLHPFHLAFTLLFTSLSQLPLSCTVNPKYLNSFTLGAFLSFIFTVSLSFPLFMHRYLVFDLLTFILFFPRHTSRILVSAPLLPWSLCKLQYYQGLPC